MNIPSAPLKIKAQPLAQEHYSPYGDVVAERADIKPLPANGGVATRYNHVAKLENLRHAGAVANFSFFRSNPVLAPNQTSFDVRLLEKHPHSTQAFIPMHAVDRFMVIVALGKDQPDLSTLKAFVTGKTQGITYRPGVWHHPLVTLDQTGDFASVVWEDGTPEDCVVVNLSAPVTVDL